MTRLFGGAIAWENRASPVSWKTGPTWDAVTVRSIRGEPSPPAFNPIQTGKGSTTAAKPILDGTTSTVVRKTTSDRARSVFIRHLGSKSDSAREDSVGSDRGETADE